MGSLKIHRSLVVAVITLAAATSAIIYDRHRRQNRKKKQKPLALSCRCGKVQAQLQADPETIIRMFCYCGDCPRYDKYVDKLPQRLDGPLPHPKPICDEYGASEVLICLKSEVVFLQGQDQCQLFKLYPQSDMHRFYSRCCGSALVNMYGKVRRSILKKHQQQYQQQGWWKYTCSFGSISCSFAVNDRSDLHAVCVLALV